MKKFFITFLISITSFCVYAQNKTSWSIGAGVSLPVGTFSRMTYDQNTLSTDCGLMDKNANCGAATTGLNIELESLIPMHNKNLYFTISADFNYNEFNSEGKDFINCMAAYFDNMFRIQFESYGATIISSSCAVHGRPSYFNIPLLVGLRYTKNISIGMPFFAEGGVGINMRFVTPMKFYERIRYQDSGYYYDVDMEEKFTYDMKSTLAFRIGVGLGFTEKISLSAYYYYLGKGDVSCAILAKDPTDSSIQPSEQSLQLGTVNPMMLVFKLNYKL
ncbi:MAG: PorT family protein [Bacteroidales bacterium]|nr:PorT family protein [Bacteroidales bacterium]